MKTNRTSIRRLALLAGAICTLSQAAQAEVAKPSAQASVAPVAQAQFLLASATCTRVGSRMVC